MDYKAKTAILSLNTMSLPCQQHFPLEPICIFVGNNKLTADMHDHLQYWVHLKSVRSTYHSLGILDTSQFDLVDWERGTLFFDVSQSSSNSGHESKSPTLPPQTPMSTGGTNQLAPPCALAACRSRRHAHTSYIAATTRGYKHYSTPST
jgi:hypothetical protein